jgi:hypothetical protein
MVLSSLQKAGSSIVSSSHTYLLSFLLHNSFNKKRVRMPIPDAQREENIKQHKEYLGIEGIGKEANISRKI